MDLLKIGNELLKLLQTYPELNELLQIIQSNPLWYRNMKQENSKWGEFITTDKGKQAISDYENFKNNKVQSSPDFEEYKKQNDAKIDEILSLLKGKPTINE